MGDLIVWLGEYIIVVGGVKVVVGDNGRDEVNDLKNIFYNNVIWWDRRDIMGSNYRGRNVYSSGG